MKAHVQSIQEAARTHSPVLPELICKFLAASTSSPEKYWRDLFWLDVVKGMDKIAESNVFLWKPPILTDNDSENNPIPWNYIGREWFFWLNLFTKEYKWTEEKIANLEIEEAFALFQEIMIDEQQRKEWEYSLSELAYKYDDSTKQSKFVPLARPSWMLPRTIKAEGKRKIPRSSLPIGEITDISGMMKDVEIIEDEITKT
jgi:hypothetical protein